MVLIRAEITVSRVYDSNGRPSTDTKGLRQFLSVPRIREPWPAIKMTASETALIFRNTFSIPKFGQAGAETGKSGVRFWIRTDFQLSLSVEARPRGSV